MHKNRQPGKTAIKVKNIVAHIKSVYDLVQNNTYVINQDGEFYSDNGYLVEAKDFERIHTVKLQPNNYMQNQTIDPRHIK